MRGGRFPSLTCFNSVAAIHATDVAQLEVFHRCAQWPDLIKFQLNLKEPWTKGDAAMLSLILRSSFSSSSSSSNMGSVDGAGDDDVMLCLFPCLPAAPRCASLQQLRLLRVTLLSLAFLRNLPTLRLLELLECRSEGHGDNDRRQAENAAHLFSLISLLRLAITQVHPHGATNGGDDDGGALLSARALDELRIPSARMPNLVLFIRS